MAKVLLVEDDIPLRDIYKEAFEAEGHAISVASDGEEAVTKAVNEKPDLILLDIMMPKVSGFEVLSYLRSVEATKNIKIVVFTALTQKKDREAGMNLGADFFIVKSEATLPDVLAKVKEVLGE